MNKISKLFHVSAIIAFTSVSTVSYANPFFENVGGIIGNITQSQKEKQQPKDVQDANNRDRGKTLGFGTLAGAAVGALTGDNKKEREKNALIGAGIGAVAGVAAGEVVASGRTAYSDEKNSIEAAVKDTNNQIASLNKNIEKTNKNIDKRNAKIESLEKKASSGKKVASQVKSLINKVDKDINKNNEAIDTAKIHKIEIDKEIKDLSADAKKNDVIAQAIVDLKTKKTTLAESIKNLNEVNDTLLAQKEQLENISDNNT